MIYQIGDQEIRVYKKKETTQAKKKREKRFREGLTSLINSDCMENESNTPDFILADYLMECLRNWNNSVKRREMWYGRENE